MNGSAIKERLLGSWPVLLFGMVWLYLFGPMMTGQTVCGFRDSGHFYYPLFKWIDAQWASGEFPVWNPYCNFGIPVVGDGTSSVFYPGKIIFWLRFLSFPSRYGIYLAIHIPIAALGTYWLAKELRSTKQGAVLSAFAYSFGGSYLFQVTNVVFLVSGAWLPFALCGTWKMVQSGDWKWVFATSLFCALMILGGDPQMVYHVGLIGCGTCFFQFFRRKRRWIRSRMKLAPGPYRWLVVTGGSRMLGLIIITSLLAAVQLIPTYEWSQLSERTNPTVTPNIWFGLADEIRFGDKQLVDALFGEPVGTGDHAYQFSQPPWTLAELAVPNFSGIPFPIHQRWSDGLPGADRVWNPSLFMGTITVILAVGSFRLWGRRRKQVWLTRISLFFAIASFGWYGIVWLCNEFLPPSMMITEVGSQVGGLYWLMYVLLPKYYAFRYPAKLFVVASLGISILAGMSLRRPSQKTCLTGIVLLAVLAVGGLTGAATGALEDWIPYVPSNTLFGPFDRVGSVQVICAAMIQMLVVVVLFTILLLCRRILSPSLWGSAIAIVILFDVLMANHWLVPHVNSTVFEQPIASKGEIEAGKRSQQEFGTPTKFFRSDLDSIEPHIWMQSSSPSRLEEVIEWERNTLFFNHYLDHELQMVGAPCSIWPADFQVYRSAFEQDLAQGQMSSRQNLRFWDYSIASGSGGAAQIAKFDPKTFYDLTGPFEIRHNFTEYSNGHMVPYWWRDIYGIEVTPSDSYLKTPKRNLPGNKNATVLHFSNRKIVLDVSVTQPSQFAMLGVLDSNWQAWIAKLEQAESEPNDALEQVQLKPINAGRKTSNWSVYFSPPGLGVDFSEPGTYRVELRYVPWGVYIGAMISGLTWLMFGGIFARAGWRRLFGG